MENNILHIYTRVSSQEQVERGTSLEAQKVEGIRKAEQLQSDYKLYEERGQSAWKENLDNRPVLMELITGCESGIVKRIFVTEWDRMTRNESAQIMIKNILKKNNVIVYTTNQVFDFNDAEDEFISSLLGILAHRENTLRVKRSKRGMREAAKLGKWHGGVTPYGYSIIKSDEHSKNNRLRINPKEKEIYLKMVKWSLEGKGCFSIARELNNLGIKTKGMKAYKSDIRIKDKVSGEEIVVPKDSMRWLSTTVLRILRSPLYKGELYYSGIVAEAPAIISENIWKQIQDNLEKNKSYSTRNNKRHFYLLRGLIVCQKCGRNLYGRTIAKIDYHSYICSSKLPAVKGDFCGLKNVNMKKMNDTVWEAVKNMLLNSDLLINKAKEYLNNKSNQGNAIKKDIELNRKQIDSEQRSKKKLLELYLKTEEFSTEELNSQSNEYNNRISILEKKVEKLENQLSLINNKMEVLNNMEYLRNSLLDQINSLTKDDIQKVIRYLVDRISIDWDKTNGHQVELLFQFPMFSDSIQQKQIQDNMIIVNHRNTQEK